MDLQLLPNLKEYQENTWWIKASWDDYVKTWYRRTINNELQKYQIWKTIKETCNEEKCIGYTVRSDTWKLMQNRIICVTENLHTDIPTPLDNWKSVGITPIIGILVLLPSIDSMNSFLKKILNKRIPKPSTN